MFLKDWTYTGSDPGLRLFTLANPLLPEPPESVDLFELGCCDTDFLERAAFHHPRLYADGVDWRLRSRPHPGCHVADILPHRFGTGDRVYDAIISLSTLEHIGLGRYEHDPKDMYGDIKAVQRLRDRLKPGGFLYFDVPYTPQGYRILDVNKCRCYDDQALLERFGPHTALGYTSPDVTGWAPKPRLNVDGIRPYWYVALLIENRKDAH